MSRPAVALTGYLAQLVERVLPTEPTLQRRQPTLFEPAQPWSGASLEEVVTERAATTVRPSGRGDVPPASPWRAAPAEASAPLPAQATSLLAHAATDSTVRAPAPSPGEAPALPGEARGVPREPPLVDTIVRVVTVNPAPRAETVRNMVQPPVAVPAGATGRAAATRVIEPPPMVRHAPPRTAEPERPRQPAAPRADPPLLPRRDRSAEAAPAVMPSRAAMRAAARSAVRPLDPAPAREPPPIEVTIGRVEVRAVAAAPSNPRSQRAAPRLSLSQYLSDRNGGGR